MRSSLVGSEIKAQMAVAEEVPTSRDSGRDVEDVVMKGKGGKKTRGERPACFKNTFHEVAFVFMATVAMATNTFFTGSTVIVTAAIGRDLDMTQSQISWITAAAT